jgi:hypothetical protein
VTTDEYFEAWARSFSATGIMLRRPEGNGLPTPEGDDGTIGEAPEPDVRDGVARAGEQLHSALTMPPSSRSR